MSICVQDFIFSDLYLEMFCERNPGGTRTLVLRGSDLVKKIGRRVKNSDMVSIVRFLRKHPEVVSLEFPYNEISDCGIFTLTEYLTDKPTIKHLNVIGNEIGPRGIGFIAELGKRLPFYNLRLTGNKIGAEGGKELSKILFTQNVLRFLDLSDTHQTMSSLAYIMMGLMPSRGGSKTLEYVDLSRPLPQEYHKVDDAHAAEFIGQILKDNDKLKELHVQQYQLDFRDVDILLEGLLANKTLICLDLNNNSIGDDGVDYLCRYLRTSPALECLMIGSNNIGNNGALSLSINLPFSKIKLLDVTNNRMTDDGMINILYTIRKVVSMRALFIWGNEMTHRSFVVLQRLFRKGLLNLDHTDVKLYCRDNELFAAWDPRVNRYTQRFYCVSEYGHEPIRKLLKPRPPNAEELPFKFKYHIDDRDAGAPVTEWSEAVVEKKCWHEMSPRESNQPNSFWGKYYHP